MVNLTETSTLRGIPEFYEAEIGEALAARTESLATFRELGPPDLVHIVKTNQKSLPKEVGSYHYLLGVDTSSSASCAAYLNSLTYIIDQSQAYTGKSLWKINSGTYCSFNAFSRVDVRVAVKIPGGVDCYVVDLRGERHEILNQAIWSETAVSAVLRALLDDNDEPDGNEGKPLLGLRKLDPLPNLMAEKRFLEAASVEFWKGWQLGTDPEIQVATYFSNHLSNGILGYFSGSYRMGEAVKFFEPLFERDPEVGAVLARAYMESNQEIEAVKCLNAALKKNPLSYGLLLVQNKMDMALKLAKLAVTYAPSEYNTWAKLTEIYIEVEDYQSALLSLNSCPMFTFCEKDSHRMPTPSRTHLPLKPEQTPNQKEEIDLKKIAPGTGTVYDDNDPEETEIHPELQRLPSLSLRGTFLKAYKLLNKICNLIGWDDLLHNRSLVFVMEEEYRIHRALVEEREKGGIGVNEEGVFEEEEEVHSPSSSSMNGEYRKSEDSDSTVKRADLVGSVDVSVEAVAPVGKSPIRKRMNSIDLLMKKVEVESAAVTAVPTGVEEMAKTTRALNPRLNRHSISFNFKSKRLCEKWLDNLFMVLYNDLRLYTALKQEFTHFRNSGPNGSSGLLYRKTGAEWEIYGDLALRLEHQEDAKESFRLCLEQKFSAKSWLRLLELLSTDGNINQTLQCIVRLSAVMDRAYIETTYPSPLSRGIFRLVQRHGLAKVQNALLAMNIPTRNYRLITRFFEYAELFKVEGVE